MMVLFGLFIGIVALVLSIYFLITSDKDFKPLFVLLIIIISGIIAWMSYLTFFIPFEMLLFDEDNKILKIRYNIKRSKEIKSDDINNIIICKNIRAMWSNITIILNNGEEIYLKRLDLSDDIDKYFKVEKKINLG